MIPLGVLAAATPRAASAAYLDLLAASPTVAYSLRKVISTATLAIRVRRSSDDAEQDIGFASNALDTAALAAFVGANNAFVTTFYDQTATGINLVQATASRQPRIVNAGTYDGMAVFDGSSDTMSATSVPFGTPRVGLHMKAAQANQSAAAVLVESSANYNSNVGAFLYYHETNWHRFGTNGGVSYRRDFNPGDLSALNTISLLGQLAVTDGTTPQQRMWVNGVSQSQVGIQGTAATPVVNFTTQNVFVGSRAGTMFFAPMRLKTLAIYSADTSSIRGQIEAIVDL